VQKLVNEGLLAALLKGCRHTAQLDLRLLPQFFMLADLSPLATNQSKSAQFSVSQELEGFQQVSSVVSSYRQGHQLLGCRQAEQQLKGLLVFS